MSRTPDGGIGGIGWWQWANGYTAIANHVDWSNDHRNLDLLRARLNRCEDQHPMLINEFNDDTLWWGLCCIRIYEIDGNEDFLKKAVVIWHHCRKYICRAGRHNCCGHDMEGGCYWTNKPGEGYLNAITTSLFAELSVRIARVEFRRGPQSYSSFGKLKNHFSLSHHIGGTDFLEAARCSIGWIVRCVYLPGDGVVMDGIDTKKNSLTNWTFTYNTGVAIGVSALIYDLTREQEYLMLACHMARCAMQKPGWVENNGVLSDLGAWGRGADEPAKNGDGVGFKAVLVRHLGTLYEVIRQSRDLDPRTMETASYIKTLINVNFQSQQERNTNGNGQYGPWWDGPFVGATSHSQLPVLDLMAVTMLVNRI
ncbi:hypothetical protein LTR86_008537 [Recurvomyces mirabilis]|nr:hypothetical protein LTR86_008537 [Recurvomyces mirabilis]